MKKEYYDEGLFIFLVLILFAISLVVSLVLYGLRPDILSQISNFVEVKESVLGLFLWIYISYFLIPIVLCVFIVVVLLDPIYYVFKEKAFNRVWLIMLHRFLMMLFIITGGVIGFYISNMILSGMATKTNAVFRIAMAVSLIVAGVKCGGFIYDKIFAKKEEFIDTLISKYKIP